ncbi:MAG: 5-formyltetrahydrofolate cyclo-ligase [Actinomycetota bacterium]
MTDLADRRRAMRLVLRERRAALDEDDHAAASMAVMARLARLPVLERAQLVGGYRGIRGEVDIDAALTLLSERGTVVTVPRVEGEQMAFLPWFPEAATIAGSFGIDEPVEGDAVPFGSHDVVLVPLVAFDADGQRLGQGGGFYDRAIAGAGDARPLLIGVAHAFQQVESVPVEPWDMPIDAVVTEERIHEFRPGCLD